jgi:hypothetical protein
MKNFLIKNKKPILIGSGILVAGVIIFLIMRKKSGISLDTQKTANTGSQATGVVYPIKRKLGADTNQEERAVISNIQRYLNSKITFVEVPLDVDGIFGEKTEAMAQRILGVKTVSYSLYKEILSKLNPSPFLSNMVK